VNYTRKLSSLISLPWTIWVQTVPCSRLRYRILVQKLTYMSKAHVVSVFSIRVSKFVPEYTAWWEIKIWAFCVFVYFGRPGFRCAFVFFFRC
jgi:hypothetical protein